MHNVEMLFVVLEHRCFQLLEFTLIVPLEDVCLLLDWILTIANWIATVRTTYMHDYADERLVAERLLRIAVELDFLGLLFVAELLLLTQRGEYILRQSRAD